MPMTLNLPAHLEQELRDEAEREGVQPTEHAALLLAIWTALLPEAGTTPFRDAVKEFLSHHALDAEHVASVLDELVEQCLAAHDGSREPQVFPPAAAGPAPLYTDLRAWRHSRVHEPVAPQGPARLAGGTRRRAQGKYAHMSGGSEDFAREKEEEIAREEGRAG